MMKVDFHFVNCQRRAWFYSSLCAQPKCFEKYCLLIRSLQKLGIKIWYTWAVRRMKMFKMLLLVLSQITLPRTWIHVLADYIIISIWIFFPIKKQIAHIHTEVVYIGICTKNYSKNLLRLKIIHIWSFIITIITLLLNGVLKCSVWTMEELIIKNAGYKDEL